MPSLSLEFTVRFPDFRPDDAELLEDMGDRIGFDPELRGRFEDFVIRVHRMMLTSEIGK